MSTKSRTVSARTAGVVATGVGALWAAGLAAAFMSPVASAARAPAASGHAVARHAKPPVPRAAAAPAPPAPYIIKSALTLTAPLNHGDWVWRPEAGPSTGPILITADLAAETLSVFRDGHEIGVAVIHYGADSKPTPLGRFPILQKDAKHKSSLYAAAPMPYMLRLTNDGVTIHGAQIDGRFGTHGCIGVPTPFARLMFGQVKVGDPVIVTRGRVLKVGEGVPAA